MKRRLLAFLLAFVMTFSLVPVNTFAAESSSTEVTASAEAVKTEGAKTTVEPAALSQSRQRRISSTPPALRKMRVKRTT